MWNSYTQNETFLTANNKDALAYYHWYLNLEIIEHTEITIELREWNFWLFLVKWLYLIRTFTDRCTLIKADGEHWKQLITKEKTGNSDLPC